MGDKTPGQREEMKKHAGLGEERKPRACVSRMRTPGSGPADALSLWYFLALTAPQPPLPRPLLGLMTHSPPSPASWVAEPRVSRGNSGEWDETGEKERQQAGFSGSSRHPVLLWPQEIKDSQAN